MCTARFTQAIVDAGEIFVKHSVVTAGPGFDDIVRSQLRDELFRPVARNSAQRPLAERYIDVDNHPTLMPLSARIGPSSRLRFAAKISRLASSGIAAP